MGWIVAVVIVLPYSPGSERAQDPRPVRSARTPVDPAGSLLVHSLVQLAVQQRQEIIDTSSRFVFCFIARFPPHLLTVLVSPFSGDQSQLSNRARSHALRIVEQVADPSKDPRERPLSKTHGRMSQDRCRGASRRSRHAAVSRASGGRNVRILLVRPQ
jgi:hypothetical protein